MTRRTPPVVDPAVVPGGPTSAGNGAGGPAPPPPPGYEARGDDGVPPLLVPPPPPGFSLWPTASGGGSKATPELRHLARASSLGLVGQASSSALAFAFSLVVGRVFKAHGAGTFYEAIALFSIASTFAIAGADFGLNRTLPRLRAQHRVGDIKRVLPVAIGPVFVWSVVLAIVLFATAPLLTPIFSHDQASSQVASFVRVLAPFLPVAALIPVLIAGTRGFDRVWPLVTISAVAVPLLRLIMLAATVGAGLGLLAVAYDWALPMVVGALACLWVLLTIANRYHHERIDSSAPTTPTGQLAKEFWGFTAPRSLTSAFNVIVLWLDVLLVGAIFSTHEAGIYAVASRYMFIPSYAMGALGGTIGPQTARLVTQGRITELRHLYQMSTTWAVALSWPLSLSLAVFAPVYMGIFGRQFVTGSSALTILSLSMTMFIATGSSLYLLIMAGSSGAGLAISATAMVVNVVANLLLIPHLGMNGAAIAWGLTLFVNNLATGLFLWHKLRLQPFTRLYAEVALVAVACFGVLGLTARVAFGANWRTLVATTLVGGAAYAAFLWSTRGRLEAALVFRRRRRSVGATT